MTSLTVPDYLQLESWLTSADIETYKCDSCNGLHLPHMQQESGVLDSKLDIEGEVLFFTTTAEVRPSKITAVLADLGELNATHPLLKVFLDINDDTLPVLVCCHSLPLSAGIAPVQVLHFVEFVGKQMRAFMNDCHGRGHLSPAAHHEETVEQAEASLLH